jgi:6-phosphogluconolactonase/glucosamine-6-phosphate isomerase/deaminase
MNFIKSQNIDFAKNYILKELSLALQGNNRVIWLVSGGSNIDIEVNVFNELSESQLDKLTILLIDERYGSVDNKDSNYLKLQNAGLDFSKVTNYSILSAGQTSPKEAAADYSKVIDDLLNSGSYIFAQLGLGADGHTAGILPNSPASYDLDESVISYTADDFTRITLTFKSLKKISKAVVVALGQNKMEPILNLANKELSLSEQPAQIFKQLPEAYIINEVTGD